jgi:hypothetical protein
VTRPKDLETARKLVALSLFNDSAAEASVAHRQARRLIAKHGLSFDELFTAHGQPLSLQDMMAMGDKVKDVVNTIKGAVSDPDVQRGVGSLVDLFKSGQEIARKVRGR